MTHPGGLGKEPGPGKARKIGTSRRLTQAGATVARTPIAPVGEGREGVGPQGGRVVPDVRAETGLAAAPAEESVRVGQGSGRAPRRTGDVSRRVERTPGD